MFALDTVYTCSPKPSHWKQWIGSMLQTSPDALTPQHIKAFDKVLEKWPDTLRTTTPALKRRLAQPPYPFWLSLLRDLSLTHTAHSIRDLESLQQLITQGRIHTLHTLRLRYCTFGSAGVQLIAERIQGLHTLTLGDCCIDSDGLKILANTPSMHTLRRLNLYSNLIQDEGVYDVLDSKYLQELTYLNLYNNQLTSDCVDTLRQTFEHTTHRCIVHGQFQYALGRSIL